MNIHQKEVCDDDLFATKISKPSMERTIFKVSQGWNRTVGAWVDYLSEVTHEIATEGKHSLNAIMALLKQQTLQWLNIPEF